MKYIVWQRPGDECCQVTLAADQSRTEEVAANICEGNPYQIIDKADMPVDFREYRNAWQKGNGVEIDLPKMRDIHMAKVRRARDAKLAKLDVDYIKADESGNASQKTSIAQEKQRLRDLPQTLDLDAITDPTALKNTWPEGL